MAADLQALVESAIQALKADTAAGVGTATTHVRITSGVTCAIEDGPWRLVADEMPGDGGQGLGPDPGVYGRAALGSCLAIGYVMWAAYLGVPVDGVEVIVEADYDAHGQFGQGEGVPPGWTGLRFHTVISSSAPEEKVRALVAHAERYSSLLDDFRRPHNVVGSLEIRRGEA
jgi:uncharacterized OsmC-like protein